MDIFISPHNDDETLFGAFSILKHRPKVIFVYDSVIQELRGDLMCSAASRRGESVSALRELGVPFSDIYFCGISDATAYKISEDGEEEGITVKDIANAISEGLAAFGASDSDYVGRVFAPLYEIEGHIHHNAVAYAAATIFSPSQITNYCTYTPVGKTLSPNQVAIEDPGWIVKKFRALTCYQSQIRKWETQPHFLRSQYEYTA